MLDIDNHMLEEIAMALSDQGGYENTHLINPKTGEFDYWSSDIGLASTGENIDMDEVDGHGLIAIDPLPSWVWYNDMVDFANRVNDELAGRRLARALRGKGAFRRFKDELYEEYPDLLGVWHAFSNARGARRAVEWLQGNKLVDDDTADKLMRENPVPDVP